MKIAIAADHAGFEFKQRLLDDLQTAQHDVLGPGTYDPAQEGDYPDFAQLACEAVRRGEVQRAILVCSSGVGVTVAANKFPGIRAGLCRDHDSAHQGVEPDVMNVLGLGARIVGSEVAREIVRAFMDATFFGDERHRRRLSKVRHIEAQFLKEYNRPARE